MKLINGETGDLNELQKKDFRTEKIKKLIKIAAISILMIILSAGGNFAYTQYEKEKTYL